MDENLRSAVKGLIARGFYSAAVRLIINETGAAIDDAREMVWGMAAKTRRQE